MSTQKKYYRYRMTYPFEGNTIYKSKNKNKVIKKCYNEYKQMDNLPEGMFGITNLDKQVEYQYKLSNNKAKKIGKNIK